MASGSIAAGIMVTGAVVSYLGAEEARAQEEKAAKANAKLKKAQAVELLDRFEINSQSLERLGQETAANQQGAYIKGGVDASTGSSLLMMEDTFSKIQRQIGLEKREADFKAKQLIRGANIESDLAGDISKAKKVENIGLFVSGAVKAASTVN